MPFLRSIAVVCVLSWTLLAAGDGQAKKLHKQAKQAERAGEVVRAYLLYSEASALDPSNRTYWARMQALKTKAALQARPHPKPIAKSEPDKTVEAAGTPHASQTAPEMSGLPASLSQQDYEDLRRLKPPPQLKGTPGTKSIDLRGDAKLLFQQAGKAFALEPVFDGDYQPGPPFRFRTADADYRQTLQQLEAATASFVVPLSDRLFLVAKDTPAKRAEVEPTVAVTVPIPTAVSVQEAQEMARAVQQAMELTRFSVDGQKQLVFMKDRVSKIRPAQLLFEQLTQQRAQVVIEIEMLEVNRTSAVSYGLLSPTQFPMVYLGRLMQSTPSIPSGITGMLLFGGGKTLFGLGVADAELFARMNTSAAQSLIKAEIRSLDGAEASFHVGDRYPILTGGFLGAQSSIGTAPSFNFEDLGLVLKIMPHVHGMDEVSLDIEAEFKVLAGQSVNGIPVIANRKLQSKVRLRAGEWAVVAGLMSNSEAKTLSGLWPLANLPLVGPLFRKNDTDRSANEVVLMLKPRLLSLPPSESVPFALHVGAETRLRIPL